MTDFLNPQEWTGDTSYSGDNFNRTEREEAETRLLSEYTSLAINQQAAAAALMEKMRRYCYTVAVNIPTATDLVVKFPAPKDNTDYGVSIVCLPTNRNDTFLGWGGKARQAYSLNVMKRDLDSVTIRFQFSGKDWVAPPGHTVIPVLVTCYGGIDF